MNFSSRRKNLVFVAVVGISLLAFGYSRQSPRSRPSGLSRSEAIPLSLADQFKKNVPVSVLLLGYGGAGHEGAFLTDSMMVAHVRPATKEVFLISIPRDLWVKLKPTEGNENYAKINTAFAQGGGDLVKEAVTTVTGLPISRYASLSFQGFREAVDALGGVEIKIEKAFDDFEYPLANRETDLCGKAPEELTDLLKTATISAAQAFPCRYEHLHFEAGSQHFDGDRALKFVRSRHASPGGSDFGRSARQIRLIEALAVKVFTVEVLPKIPELLQNFRQNVKMDFDIIDIKELLELSFSAREYALKGINLSSQNVFRASVSGDGQYILIPHLGSDQWTATAGWLASRLDSNKKIGAPVVQIENASGINGLGEKVANLLLAQGFNVLPPMTAKERRFQTQITVTILSEQLAPGILEKVQKILAVGSPSVINQVKETSNGPELIIRLGTNFKPLF